MTDKTRFTPGPWEWTCDYHHKDGPCPTDPCPEWKAGRITLRAAGVEVLGPWGDYAADLGLTVDEGNLPIIAAAPDLYTALEEVEKMFAAGYLTDFAGAKVEPSTPLRVKARAALAKARGGQR